MWSPEAHEFDTPDLAYHATPVSNAVGERIFSLLTAVKSKPRNEWKRSS